MGGRVKNADPTMKAVPATRFVAGFKSGTARPHHAPNELTHGPELGGGGRGQLPFVPEFAQDHAVREQSATLQGTGAGGQLSCSSEHVLVHGLPIFLDPRGGQMKIKPEHTNRQRGWMDNEAR